MLLINQLFRRQNLKPHQLHRNQPQRKQKNLNQVHEKKKNLKIKMIINMPMKMMIIIKITDILLHKTMNKWQVMKILVTNLIRKIQSMKIVMNMIMTNTMIIMTSIQTTQKVNS